MSSMLKKPGGLSFKPKAKPKIAARRPGGGETTSAPQATADTVTSTTTGAPTDEPQSLASTPAPTSVVPSVSAPQASNETAIQGPQDTLKDATPAVTKPAKAAKPLISQPTPEPTAPTPLTQRQVPQLVLNSPVPTSSILVGSQVQSQASTAPAVIPQPQPATSAATTPVPTQSSTPNPSTTTTQRSIGQSTPAPEGPIIPTTAISQHTPCPAASAPRRTLPSPSRFPVSDTITAVPPQTDARLSVAPPKQKRVYCKRAGPAGVDNNDEGSSAPKPKRQRKTTAPAAGNGQNNGDISDGEVGRAAPTLYRRRRREPTPEDAEEQRLDLTTTKVGDLTRDLFIGKKFKHADAIAERQRQMRRDAKLKKLERQKRAMGLLPDENETTEDSRAGTPADGDAGTPAPEVAQADSGGNIDYQVIDGQIVINQASLQVDHHAGQETPMETVEEDEFTHLTTSATYMRPSRAMGGNHWTDEDTERFYHYLQMFGTDFETISHLFPGKTRRHIKLKFNREEKARPKRVNASMMARGTKPVAIDLDEYKSNRRGVPEWEEKEKIEEMQKRLAEEHEADLEALRQERREAGLLDEEEEPAEEETGESQGDKDKGQENAPAVAEVEVEA